MAPRRAGCLAVALLLGAGRAASGQAADRHFSSGYAGTLPTDPKDLARTYFNAPPIRRLIYRLENGPATRGEVDSALAGTDFSADELLRLKILSQTDGRFQIGFNYFSASDMEAIHRAAARYVPTLVAGYLAKRAELRQILAAYPAKSVPEPRLAFALIAGISLNWDGLKIGLEKGYRRPNLVTGPGWKYSFWASETVPNHSSRDFIWGSTTFPAGSFNYRVDPVDYAFSSFGDPASDPRMNLPDLLYLPRSELPEPVQRLAAAVGFHDESRFGMDFKDVLGFDVGRPIATLLFALRRGPRTPADLTPLVPPAWRARVPAILDLLAEVQYLSVDRGGRYHLTMPVLDRDDAVMTGAALALSRQVVEAWLAECYGPIKADLAGLTAIRQGVAYQSLFTQIWHELFGLATKQLATAEVIEDARGSSVRYPGSLALLWRTTLYHLDAQ